MTTETDASGWEQLDKVLLYLWSTTGSRSGANGRQSQLDYGKRQARMAVERIVAERLRVVEGERDAAHEAGYWVGYREGKDEAETRDLNYDEATVRAESAEAAHAALWAGIEALAGTWDTTADQWPYAVWHDQQKANARDLRALLPASDREGDGR